MSEHKNNFSINGIPERSLVLQALGITKEQDDAMQAKFANPDNYYIDVRGIVTLLKQTIKPIKEKRLDVIKKRKSNYKVRPELEARRKWIIDQFRINP